MYKITTRVSSVADFPMPDQEKFVDWIWSARKINCFDPDILLYPRTILYTAEDQDGPLLYLPVQPVLMLESLAPRPGVSPRKEALALWKLGEMLEETSRITGIQEQYFLCKDQRVVDICSRHGFDKLEGYTILRKKVPVPVPTQEG
jgi:hypothetical protein